jgi:hypothetical protein
MSSAATGRAREHSVMMHLEKLGYVTFRSPGSHGIDVFCVPKSKDTGLPYLAVEVGGSSKAVARAYEALRKQNLPAGTILLLVRRLKPRASWTWYGSMFERFDNPLDAINCARRNGL